jgi:hypothetical protein
MLSAIVAAPAAASFPAGAEKRSASKPIVISRPPQTSQSMPTPEAMQAPWTTGRGGVRQQVTGLTDDDQQLRVSLAERDQDVAANRELMARLNTWG